MKTLKQLLNETTRDDCIRKFGKTIFGYSKGVEGDTDYEKMVYEVIEEFIINNEVDQELIKAIMALGECRMVHTGIKSKPGQKVYRGVGKPAGLTLKQPHFNKLKWKLDGKSYDGMKMYSADGFTYKAHRQVQSFTFKQQIAEMFGFYGSNSPGYVIETKTTSDFIFTKPFIKYLDTKVGMAQEEETIRMTKNPLKCKIYLLEETYKDYEKDRT